MRILFDQGDVVYDALYCAWGVVIEDNLLVAEADEDTVRVLEVFDKRVNCNDKRVNCNDVGRNNLTYHAHIDFARELNDIIKYELSESED